MVAHRFISKQIYKPRHYRPSEEDHEANDNVRAICSRGTGSMPVQVINYRRSAVQVF